jgi:heptose I phosphotransferase
MSGTFWLRLVKGVRRLRQRPDWAQFADPDWPEQIMRVPVTDDFHAKQGRTTGRWVLHNAGNTLVVYLKRHYRLPCWRGILATLWPGGGWSPALQEWRNLNRASSLGLPVPRPVAAAEYIGPWCQLQSFLAVEELNDMVPLHEAVPEAAKRLDASAFQRWKEGLILEVARLTRWLHDGRYFHKDLYLCHFYIPRRLLVPTATWRGEVYLIDLHRFGRHPLFWRRWQIKDLAQLLFSSDIDGIDDRDRLCFWRAYRGRRNHRLSTTFLRALVLLKYRQYRRHNAAKAA